MPSTCPDDRRYAVALSLAEGVGSVAWRERVAAHGSAAAAFEATVPLQDQSPLLREAERAVARSDTAGAAVWCLGDAEYPEVLADLPDPPPVLFAMGDRGALAGPAVAVVGTRRATAYGLRAARELGRSLARAGATVVSGMAVGIDAAAHEGALEAGGHTVAVLGTGVDVAYPAAHRGLHARIRRAGLLLSELFPGDKAGPASFPRRNRIIAALGRATIVVEAGSRSGALITAAHALEIGRTVAAVPGPIDVPQASGSNELLRDGAAVIAAVADALSLVGLASPGGRAPTGMSPDEAAVWSSLGDGALDADTLTVRSGLPAARCLAAVSALEVRGAVACALTGEIARRV
ncbi:MAG TPA: DNA-processing protein DprA [Gemmatimonadaceae bacterium]|nr:DNA-processing protein DprA [Gemmatimonadaceae bacterium]